MAEVLVRNSATGDMGVAAARRSRYERAEVAFGKIPAEAYESEDTLVFDQIPCKEIIHGEIVTSEGHVLKIFNGTDIDEAIDWTYDSDDGTTVLDLYYHISYIRGTGRVHPGLANSAAEKSSEYGKLLQVTVTVE